MWRGSSYLVGGHGRINQVIYVHRRWTPARRRGRALRIGSRRPGVREAFARPPPSSEPGEADPTEGGCGKFTLLGSKVYWERFDPEATFLLVPSTAHHGLNNVQGFGQVLPDTMPN